MRDMSQSITAAIKAGTNPETTKPGTMAATSNIKIAFMTNVNRPSVKILIGNVNITSIGLIMAFATPNNSATINEVIKLSTLKPGTMFAVINIAMADKIQLARILTIR